MHVIRFRYLFLDLGTYRSVSIETNKNVCVMSGLGTSLSLPSVGLVLNCLVPIGTSLPTFGIQCSIESEYGKRCPGATSSTVGFTTSNYRGSIDQCMGYTSAVLR